jgi:MoaA/NifB/PqqE/SkfB family radical SAM enzyme
MLNDKVARELIELNVYKVAISLDGFRPETHDTTRGVPGAFRRTIRGVERLKRLRDQLHGTTSITIHTILDASTIDEIPSVLNWVAATKLDGFHLVPLDQNVGGIDHGVGGYNFEEAWFDRNPLWIRDIPKLERLIEYMIQKKHEGYPIVDPVTYLQHTIPYFRDKGGIQAERPCRAGSELVKVTPKGEVTFCPYEPPVGDLRTSTIEEIWTGEKAVAARKKVHACTKKCFIPFCAWDEKERMGRFWEMFVKKPWVSDFIRPTVEPLPEMPMSDPLSEPLVQITPSHSANV